MSSYFHGGGKHPEYEGRKVYFDLNQVRPKGSKISGGFKAPGPEPLRLGLDRIEYILQGIVLSQKNSGNMIKLRPIQVYDICMHAADAVLSGGVRRSATICLFSPTDKGMIAAKTGNWLDENPQRARSNNSAIIVRKEATREEFHTSMTSIKEYGEPGFVFVESKEHTVNPCVTGDTVIKVKDHDITLNNELIAVGSEYSIKIEDLVKIFNETGNLPLISSYNIKINQVEWKPILWAGQTKKQAQLIKITDNSTQKSIKVTPDHKIWTENRGYVEAKDLFITDALNIDGNSCQTITLEYLDYTEDVYDITVLDNHNFYGNDILVHNCVEIGMFPQFEGVSGWQGCVSYDTKLITRNGLEYIGDVVKENRKIDIWNGKKWSTVKPFKTGENRTLYRVSFSDGSYLDCTDNHKFIVNNEEVELKNIISKFNDTNWVLPRPDIISDFDGIEEGNAFNYGWLLSDEVIRSITKKKNSELVYEESMRILYDVNHKSKLEIPKQIFTWNRESIIQFINGWIDCDGVSNGKEFKIYGRETNIRDGQLLLTKLGMVSTICKLTSLDDIWYLDVKNNNNLKKFKKVKSDDTSDSLTITNIEKLDGLHDSFCFEESKLHQGVFNNVLTKQCNLCEINGGMCIDEEAFYKACRAGAILGTLQAGYTNFKFISDTSKKIFDREALLGVSITGWMNNPNVLFDENVLEHGAAIVKQVNEDVAKLIKINPAARTTTVKPSGNASVLLMTASGIHSEHAPMYIRHIQLNKETEVAQLLKKTNPYMVEESVWSTNKSDYVVSFPVIAKEGSYFKDDYIGIKHLELIRIAQKHWVNAGTNVQYCVDPTVRHNVSNTVTVDDWDEIEEYVFTNRDSFAGISFLAKSGDKDYEQAPNTQVYTAKEIVDKYGTGAMFASGLVVEALKAFDTLWSACMTAKGLGQDISSDDNINLLKKDWVRRFDKYAVNYFNNNKVTAEHCLKDAYNLHKWEKIQQNIVDVNWTKQLVEKKFIAVDSIGAAACVGKDGGCLI